MRTFVITGVSGPLGQNVLQRIASQPFVSRLVCIDRRPLVQTAPRLQFVQSDLETADLTSLLSGADVLVHLAARGDVAVARQLLESATQMGVRHVIFLSSATVFGAWPGNSVPLPEVSPLRPNPGFAYAVRLGEIERMVGDWRTKFPALRIAMLRLALILGAGYEQELAVLLGGLTAHRPSNNSRPVQFLHIDDAASAVTHAAINELDGTYNVAPNGFIGDADARAVAGTAPRPGLPRRLAFLVNSSMFHRHYRAGFLSIEPYLSHPWVIASDRLRASGWSPAYTNEEALVAESQPSWWAGLRLGHRRTIVTTGITAGGAGIFAGVAMGIGTWARRCLKAR